MATAITPEDLNQGSSINLAKLTDKPAYDVASLDVPAPTMAMTPQEEKISGLSSTLKNLYNSLTGKSSYQSEQEKKFGVDLAQQSITDLTSQLDILKNEASAIPLQMDKQIERQGTILGSAYTSEQNKRIRDNAIAALGVSSLLSASQGQLANAKMKAEKAVNEKYSPIQEQIDALIKNLELIKDDPQTSLEDKKRAQAQLDIQNAKKAQVEAAAENATQVWNIATNAAANGTSFKKNPLYPTLSTALQAISQSPTKERALEIALQTGLLNSTTSGSQQIIGGVEMGYYSVDKNGKVTSLLKGTGSTKKTEVKVGDYASALTEGATYNGRPVIGIDGYIDPQVWKSAISDAASNNISRADFIKTYGNLINTKNKAEVGKYGLTASELKLITG